MRDPHEGVTADGMIVTGADRRRIGDNWWPLLNDLVAQVQRHAPDAAVFLYGSVATGQAVVGESDVDVITIGLPSDTAALIARELSAKYADQCRGVEIGAAKATDFVGEHDEAYGNQVFLRHYCVSIAGPTDLVPNHDFPADDRSARGFNGDIARHAGRWRTQLASEAPDVLARRIGRKSLLAVAGLVSVHDDTWTTDRSLAARRWVQIEPRQAPGLRDLLAWSAGDTAGVSSTDIEAALDSVVSLVVDEFTARIGLWPDTDF